MSDKAKKGEAPPPDRDPRRIPDGDSEYEKKSQDPGDLQRRTTGPRKD